MIARRTVARHGGLPGTTLVTALLLASLLACPGALAQQAVPASAGTLVAPAQSATPPSTPSAAAPAPLRQPPASAPPVTMPASNSPGAAGLLQTIFALLLVLGLLIALAWVMKRYAPKAIGGTARLRVVGALNIGGRERIMVVEVGDQWIVVGAAPGRVNALHTMPRQEGELTASAAEGGMPAARFADWLKHTMDKRNAT